MNNLTVFQFESNQVRVLTVGGEPWFVAKDLCAVLDLGNSSQAISRLDEDEKGVTTDDTLGGKQELATVSESGMYSLVLTSRKAQAKMFKRWLTHEVLPSIRKTGRYEIDAIAPTPKLPQNYLEALKALVSSEEQKALLEVQVSQMGEEIERQAEVIDELFDYSSIIRIAKFNKVSEKSFNWRTVKAASKVLNLEVKHAPCPRYGVKNLYHHEAWKRAYPQFDVPECLVLIH